MSGKEVDRLGSRLLPGHDQVPFVFPIFVIYNNYERALLNIFNCVFYRVESGLVSHPTTRFPLVSAVLACQEHRYAACAAHIYL